MNSPKTFSELLEQSTAGPFKVCRIRPEDSYVMLDPGLALFPRDGSEVTAEADAELVCRLLDFAHAGGVQAIERVIGDPGFGQIMGVSNADLRKCLAILNGETNP